jgi:hypothetical protein
MSGTRSLSPLPPLLARRGGVSGDELVERSDAQRRNLAE